MASSNVNRNLVADAEEVTLPNGVKMQSLPKYGDRLIIRTISRTISDDGPDAFVCLMEDGTTAVVPASHFEGGSPAEVKADATALESRKRAPAKAPAKKRGK